MVTAICSAVCHFQGSLFHLLPSSSFHPSPTHSRPRAPGFFPLTGRNRMSPGAGPSVALVPTCVASVIEMRGRERGYHTNVFSFCK